MLHSYVVLSGGKAQRRHYCRDAHCHSVVLLRRQLRGQVFVLRAAGRKLLAQCTLSLMALRCGMFQCADAPGRIVQLHMSPLEGLTQRLIAVFQSDDRVVGLRLRVTKRLLEPLDRLFLSCVCCLLLRKDSALDLLSQHLDACSLAPVMCVYV
jgi:hypothetical protein